ncbi:hypothetical protein DFH11DRAFT_865331 [Phellopilus nigrolimitatus]|nr:hypothetical protein DFH11DRAFT_865331 [Phellopilus nigrolimitatus]
MYAESMLSVARPQKATSSHIESQVERRIASELFDSTAMLKNLQYAVSDAIGAISLSLNSSTVIKFEGVDKVLPEIWREILVLASSPPPINELGGDSYICGCNYDTTFGWPFGRTVTDSSREKRFRKYLRVNMKFALISRKLWDVASEFLFRTLLISNVEKAASLAASVVHRSSLSGIAVRSWTRHIMAKPDVRNVQDFKHFENAASPILCYCSDLRSVTILAAPHRGYYVQVASLLWKEQWGKLMQHVPHGVQRLHVKVPRDGICVFQYAESLRALCFSGVTLDCCEWKHTLPQLTHLSVRFLPGEWSLNALTHLYISHLGGASEFWKMTKPTLILLHIGRNAILSPASAEIVLSGIPNLKFLEYFYFRPMHDYVWNHNYFPKSLIRVSIKTFVGVDDSERETRLYRTDGPSRVQLWRKFARHISFFHPSWYSSGRLAPSVMILVPKEAACEGWSEFFTEVMEFFSHSPEAKFDVRFVVPNVGYES